MADAFGEQRGHEGGRNILRLRPRVTKHIVPADRIGGHRLDTLTVAQVEEWLRREAESGATGGKPQARATCRDYKQMLGEMLEWAISRRYVTWNPARVAKLPKDRSATNPDAASVYKTSKAKESFNREQYAALIGVLTATGEAACKTRSLAAYFVALLSTGARPGEIDGLRWEQVDFENRTITLDHAIKRADGGRPLSIGPTKTGNRRDVEMTDLLVVALHRHRKQQAERRLAIGPLWTADPRWVARPPRLQEGLCQGRGARPVAVRNAPYRRLTDGRRRRAAARSGRPARSQGLGDGGEALSPPHRRSRQVPCRLAPGHRPFPPSGGVVW